VREEKKEGEVNGMRDAGRWWTEGKSKRVMKEEEERGDARCGRKRGWTDSANNALVTQKRRKKEQV